ncbi:MAG TPA: hypothetical protein VKV95_08740 [Terriglobia bacterium]|nr:hypothetical protein [Terriglobia bacterium]
MQRITFFLACAALGLSIFAVTRLNGPSHVIAADKNPWEDIRNYPPLVFTSKATLDCSISSTANGRQVMKTTSGAGFSFDALMLPIKDGLVKVKDPGMMYKFTAFPTSTVKAHFAGLGDGTITEMQVEVEVDVKRFKQAGGPGTTITFSAADITSDAAYVEYTGVFVRDSDRKIFPFRVVFNSVTEGRGSVVPARPGPEVPLMSKMVSLGSLQNPAIVTTALYEAEEGVRKLQ